MLNTVVLVGRLTKDPELTYTPSGVAVTRFTIAVNRPFSNQQGQREADFVNCVVWRKPAENLANYMRKGNLIGVDGRIQTRNFDDKDGKRVFVTEVVANSVSFLESNRNQQNTQQNNQQNNQQSNQQSAPQDNTQSDYSGEPMDISDDDLPF